MVYRSCSYATSVRDDSGVLKSKDRVVINVGGSRHECYLSTIQNFPDTRLYWIAESAKKMVDFDPDRNEFFFDRHPGCFQNILNYCRTGKLHCPNDVCGPLFEQELGFWGVDELMMEPCCWGNYTQHREAHKNLKMFDKIYSDETEEQEDDDQDNMQTSKSDQSRTMQTLMHTRKVIWGIMEKPFFARHAQVYALVNMVIIILSILTFCLQTVSIFRPHEAVFEKMEYFYCAYFTIEFIVRMAVCPSLKQFFKSPMTWIDFVSTMQFYYNFCTARKTLDFLFVSRLIRIFRLFRFFKNLSGMQVIAKTLKSSAQELCLLAILMCIPMLIFSTLMYYAEMANPNTFPDIPSTCWWAIITMTTVGYGDDVPKSLLGKVIGVMTCFSGILILALPVSVIGSNFTLYYSYAQARMRLPKRRSPALVTADKALMHDGISGGVEDTDQKPKPRQRQGKGSITHTLQDLANVMVDVTVPARERRHAILPEINHIRKTKPSKQKGIVRTNNEKGGAEQINEIEENEEKTAGGKLLSLNNKFKTIFNTIGQKQESSEVEKQHEPESPLLDGTQKSKKSFEESVGSSPHPRKKKHSIDGTDKITAKNKSRRRGLSELELKPPGHNSFSGQTFLDAGSPVFKKSTCIPNKVLINEGRSPPLISYHENAFPIKGLNRQRRKAIINNSVEENLDEIDENKNSFSLPNQTILVNNSHVSNSFHQYAEERPVSNSFSEHTDQSEDETNARSKLPKVHYEPRENLPPSLNTEDRAIFNPLLLTECV